MTERINQSARPLYSEFQGYLSQAPSSENARDSTSDEALWQEYNDPLPDLAPQNPTSAMRPGNTAGQGQSQSRTFLDHTLRGGE